MRFTNFHFRVYVFIVVFSFCCDLTSCTRRRINQKLQKRTFTLPTAFDNSLVPKVLRDTLKDWVNEQINKGHGREDYIGHGYEHVVQGPDLSVSASSIINSEVQKAYQPTTTTTTTVAPPPALLPSIENKIKAMNVVTKKLVDNAMKQEWTKMKLLQQQNFLNIQYQQQQFKEQQQMRNEVELKQQRRELEMAKFELEKEKAQLSQQAKVQPGVQQYVQPQKQYVQPSTLPKTLVEQLHQIGQSPIVQPVQQIGQKSEVQPLQQYIPPPVAQHFGENDWKPVTHTLSNLASLPPRVQPLQQIGLKPLVQPLQQNIGQPQVQPLQQNIGKTQVQPLQQNVQQPLVVQLQNVQKAMVQPLPQMVPPTPPPTQIIYQSPQPQQVQPLQHFAQPQQVQRLQQFPQPQVVQQPLPSNMRLITIVPPIQENFPKLVLRPPQQNEPPYQQQNQQQQHYHNIEPPQPVQIQQSIEPNIAMEPPTEESHSVVFQDPPLDVFQDTAPEEICKQRQLGPGKIENMRTVKGKYCKVKVIQWETCRGKEPISVYSNNFPGACKSMNKVMNLAKAVSRIPAHLSKAVLRRFSNNKRRRVYKVRPESRESQEH